MKSVLTAALLGLSATSVPVAALAAEPVGHLILESRLRYEAVDQDGFARTASALTLRTRLGFETAPFHGFKALIEGENVVALQDDYNSSTNGHVAFPSIPDPEGTEINRAQISWTSPRVDVTVGRQRIILGNARFIGNSGFRQNEQTFDAARLVVRPNADLTATYIYIDNVRRIFGDDHPLGVFHSDSHLMQVDARTPAGQIAAYGYLLDFRNAPTLSSATWGARLTGARPIGDGVSVTYEAEYARQTDHAGNPSRFAHTYVAGAIGLRRNTSSIAVGLERLGGNGVTAFQTPLGTLHAFQGWADVFLTTPADGVRDLNLRAGTTLNLAPGPGAVRVAAAAHDFASARGGRNFGREFDLQIGVPVVPRVTAELTAASFSGQNGFSDRTKVWVTLEFKY